MGQQVTPTKLQETMHTLIVDIPKRVRKLMDLPEDAEIGVLLTVTTPDGRLGVELNFHPDEVEGLLYAIREATSRQGIEMGDKHAKH